MFKFYIRHFEISSYYNTYIRIFYCNFLVKSTNKLRHTDKFPVSIKIYTFGMQKYIKDIADIKIRIRNQ